MRKVADNILESLLTLQGFKCQKNTRKKTQFGQTNETKHNPELFAGLPISIQDWVFPTKPPVGRLHGQSLQLCFQPALKHPRKWGLCFARSGHSPQTGMLDRRAVAVGRGPSAPVPAKEERRQGPDTGAKRVTKVKRAAGKKARSETDCRSHCQPTPPYTHTHTSTL